MTRPRTQSHEQQMSWENVKSALHELPHEGRDGFEGFAAELLSALLNQPFIGKRQAGRICSMVRRGW